MKKVMVFAVSFLLLVTLSRAAMASTPKFKGHKNIPQHGKHKGFLPGKSTVKGN